MIGGTSPQPKGTHTMPTHNPSHPGELLQEVIQELGMSSSQFAQHLGVSRNTISRIVTGKAGVTAEMSIKIFQALGRGEPGQWFRMQNNYDLWHAERAKRKKIKPIPRRNTESAEIVDVGATRVA